MGGFSASLTKWKNSEDFLEENQTPEAFYAWVAKSIKNKGLNCKYMTVDNIPWIIFPLIGQTEIDFNNCVGISFQGKSGWASADGDISSSTYISWEKPVNIHIRNNGKDIYSYQSGDYGLGFFSSSENGTIKSYSTCQFSSNGSSYYNTIFSIAWNQDGGNDLYSIALHTSSNGNNASHAKGLGLGQGIVITRAKNIFTNEEKHCIICNQSNGHRRAIIFNENTDEYINALNEFATQSNNYDSNIIRLYPYMFEEWQTKLYYLPRINLLCNYAPYTLFDTNGKAIKTGLNIDGKIYDIGLMNASASSYFCDFAIEHIES